MGQDRRKERRYNVLLDAHFGTAAADGSAVRVTNLSGNGCRFVSASPLRKGSMITLTFGRVGSVKGKVRWRIGSSHGVRFARALHPVMLDHIRLFLSEEPALVEECGAALG